MKAMKRIIFTALLTVALGSASQAREFVAEGKTNSALGDYRIEVVDNPMMLNGDKVTAFVISYQNTPVEVQVAIRKDRDCKKYIVLSDKLCVQYVCKENYFGVERLDASLIKEGFSTSDQFLDRNEYFHQKVITSAGGSDVDYMKLIASYFPMLLKNKGEDLAVR